MPTNETASVPAPAARYTAKDLTYGVEIECGVDLDAPVTPGAYHSGNPMPSLPAFDGRLWRAERDGSLSFQNKRSVEFVSPILKGAEGLDNIRATCAQVKAWGGTVNRSCGLHIHVHFPVQTVAMMRRLTQAVGRFEDALYACTGTPERRESSYCRPIKVAKNREIDWARFNDKNQLLRSDAGSALATRYCILNWQNLLTERCPTVEFRVFSGTLNPAKIAAWVQVCLTLVEMALDGVDSAWDIKPGSLGRFGKSAGEQAVGYMCESCWRWYHRIDKNYGELGHRVFTRKAATKTLKALAVRYDERRGTRAPAAARAAGGSPSASSDDGGARGAQHWAPETVALNARRIRETMERVRSIRPPEARGVAPEFANRFTPFEPAHPIGSDPPLRAVPPFEPFADNPFESSQPFLARVVRQDGFRYQFEEDPLPREPLVPMPPAVPPSPMGFQVQNVTADDQSNVAVPVGDLTLVMPPRVAAQLARDMMNTPDPSVRSDREARMARVAAASMTPDGRPPYTDPNWSALPVPSDRRPLDRGWSNDFALHPQLRTLRRVVARRLTPSHTRFYGVGMAEELVPRTGSALDFLTRSYPDLCALRVGLSPGARIVIDACPVHDGQDAPQNEPNVYELRDDGLIRETVIGDTAEPGVSWWKRTRSGWFRMNIGSGPCPTHAEPCLRHFPAASFRFGAIVCREDAPGSLFASQVAYDRRPLRLGFADSEAHVSDQLRSLAWVPEPFT